MMQAETVTDPLSTSSVEKETIGAWIKRRLVERRQHMTQKELAKAAGDIAESHLSGILKNTKHPSQEATRNLAIALNEDVTSLEREVDEALVTAGYAPEHPAVIRFDAQGRVLISRPEGASEPPVEPTDMEKIGQMFRELLQRIERIESEMREWKPDRLEPDLLDSEERTFQRHKAELLERAREQFVLIKGEDIIEIFPTQVEAIKKGLQLFLDQPFLVRKILEKEEPIYIFSSFSVSER